MVLASKLVCLALVLVIVASLCSGKILGTPATSGKSYDERLHPKFFKTPRAVNTNDYEYLKDHWMAEGEAFVKQQDALPINTNAAKNVIFFIGDGMSLATIAATRMYLGGEEKKLSFEKFPYTGLVKTYCLDKTVPDSASTATSYLRGVKANYGTIGVHGRVKRKDCIGAMDKSNHVHSIAKWALDAGKDAGVVTTTRITHASPAGVYAYTAERYWENDASVAMDCGTTKVDDIALQLVHGVVGSKLKVAMGGGRREFRVNDIEEAKKGNRIDGRDLIQEWKDKANGTERRVFVHTTKQLLSVDPQKTDKLLGLFSMGHMLYHLEAKENKQEHINPTLAEMTKKAIEVLQTGDKGFFLFVEGGKIDIAHHQTYARIAFDETAEFSKAIETALSMTNTNDTLIVVSSDHSHTMSYGGYPDRHNDIFGSADISDLDHIPYMTISYANGKSFKEYVFDAKTGKRKDPTKVDRSPIMGLWPATVPLVSETHGGEDVGVFASGPYAHLFTGAYEQSFLPHLMAYAACIGEGHKACN